MPLEPEDWNVVVAGRWNPALFTPAAISSRIFQLPEGTPIEVFVVVDDVQLPRTRHEGIVVAPSASQIRVAPETLTFKQFERACVIAHRTIEELPRTPLIAAGFNLRYRADAMPQSLMRRFSQELDGRFSDQDFKIVARQLHRIVNFREGRLLVQVTHDPDGKSELLLNFERRSKDAKVLSEWLSLPVQDIRENVIKILSDVLQLEEEDYVIEQDEHAHAHEQQGEVATGGQG